MITILAIGKKHEDWVTAGIERYQQRLKPPYDVEWILLPHSSLNEDNARKEESERIMKRMPERAHTVLLDERGKLIDSPGLSEYIENSTNQAQDICFLIGGAYGVSEELAQRANTTLSLSKMVFPHQLVRLILIEQLYRAQEISRGGKYHHQ